jgi:ABC-2 type transport system ATP-binding protein
LFERRIDFEGVSRRFGSIVALAELSLHVAAGEVCVLLGRNGAGKTTALRAAVSLTHPDSGRVRLGGVPTSSLEIYGILRSVGYLPQTSAVYEHLTGWEFLRFVGGLYGAGPECFAAARQRLERIGMHEASSRLIRSYSLGMRRRIGLLAATLHDPAYLILDEPSASLDDAGVAMVEELVTACRASGGVALVSTHDRALADRIATRICILDEGRLVFDQPAMCRK